MRSTPALEYPATAEEDGVAGRVVIGAVANADGTIEASSVQTIESVHPLLDAEAERWVRESTVWPACRDGEPVRVRIAVPVVFARGSSPLPSVRQAFMIGLLGGMGAWLASAMGG